MTPLWLQPHLTLDTCILPAPSPFPTPLLSSSPNRSTVLTACSAYSVADPLLQSLCPLGVCLSPCVPSPNAQCPCRPATLLTPAKRTQEENVASQAHPCCPSHPSFQFLLPLEKAEIALNVSFPDHLCLNGSHHNSLREGSIEAGTGEVST